MSIFSPPRPFVSRVIEGARPTKGKRVRVKSGEFVGLETNVAWYGWDSKRGRPPRQDEETNGLDGYLVGLPGLHGLIYVEATNVDVFEDTAPRRGWR